MLRWSLPIGTVLGIRMRLHFTLLLLFAAGAYHGWTHGHWSGVVFTLCVIPVLLAIILLHELGHSVAALRYNVRVLSITLLPIGGVASMGNIPERPWQEFVIAISGPLVNVLIAIVLALFTGTFIPLDKFIDGEMSYSQDMFIPLIQLNNLWILGFNLLPVFPMDGGRIFRAFLACFTRYERATFIASVLGRFIAALFIIFGHYLNWFLSVIGVFVFFSAGYENRWVKLRTQLRGRTAADIMKPFAAVISPDHRLSDVLTLIHRVPQLDFPVFEGAHLVGLLPREDWMEASQLRLDDPPVREIMNTRFTTVRPHIELSRLIYDRRALKQSFFPVVDDGRLVGLITRHDLDEAQATAFIVRPPAPHSLPPPLPPRRGLTIDMG